METEHFFSYGKKEHPKKDFFELRAWDKNNVVVGVDEVGRGCLAGPVVAAAVILPIGAHHRLLKDSKTLTPSQLQEAHDWLCTCSIVSIGIISPWIIDTNNIYEATKKAMNRAITGIIVQQEHFGATLPSIEAVLIDAMPLTMGAVPIPIVSFNKGESYSRSIAAASIVAKVTRDNLMARLSPSFPHYALHSHKGYGTPMHAQVAREQGLSFIHRTSFTIPGGAHEEQRTLFC